MTNDEAEPDGGTAAGEEVDPEGEGRQAESPTEIPSGGWKQVALRVKDESKKDNVPLLSAGLAFYGLLAAVPGMVAIISLYGLVSDPKDISKQVNRVLGSAPPSARSLAKEQLMKLTSSSGGGLGIGVVLGILVGLWSASAGMKHLIEAVNSAYDEEESRGYVALRLRAIALTVGVVAFLAVAVAVITVLPGLFDHLGVVGSLLLGVARFGGLFAAFIVGLGVLYRYAPDRDKPQWQWVSWGSGVAAVIWVVASIGFSVYAANFGKFNKTYGSLGAVIVLLLWLEISAAVVLLGAELNAELERQTRRDSTEGTPRSMGERDAYAADTVGGDPPG